MKEEDIRSQRHQERISIIRGKIQADQSLADMLEMNWLCPEEMVEHEIENKVREVMSGVIEV